MKIQVREYLLQPRSPVSAPLDFTGHHVDPLGDFLGVAMCADPVDARPAAEQEFRKNPLARKICETAQRLGLIVHPAGVSRQSQAVLVAPPLTISDVEVEELILRLANTVNTVQRELTRSEAGL